MRFLICLAGLAASTPHGLLAKDSEGPALCIGCHSPTGTGIDPGIPMIAGQSPIFITYAVKAYAAGAWPSPVMEPIARTLTDKQIREAAEYFSRQPTFGEKQVVDGDKAERGERIHAELCEKCHINGGRDYDEYEAILVGQWMEHLRKVLAQYRRGERAAEAMMLKKLSKLGPAEVEALVHYYGRGE
jgi:sulfide dehydrogenase cytochrome subunit